MEVTFIKTSPTENMTILVETPIPEEEHLTVAKRLIAYNSVYAEQAGFIHEPRDKRAVSGLRMMAGEFCGNATLSLAAWVMDGRNVPVGTKETMLLEVSGAENLVKCDLQKEEQGYFGSVEMPLPLSVEEALFSLAGKDYSLPVVGFQGITHIIVEKNLWGEAAREMAEQAAMAWAERMPVAFGILLWAEETKELEPLVYLQGASLIWERGCGSGTSAIGAYAAVKRGESVSLHCKEPGGIMGVEAHVQGGKLISLSISGHVDIVAVGKAHL